MGQPLSAIAPSTASAETVDHETVTLTGIVVRFRQDRCHALEAFIAKLGDLATHRADEMFVIGNPTRRFVALEPFTKIALHHQPAAHQHFQRAIHRRRTGTGADEPQFGGHILGREMPIGTQHRIGNGEALRRGRKIVVTQECAERTTIGFDGRSVRVSRRVSGSGLAHVAGYPRVTRRARAICAAE